MNPKKILYAMNDIDNEFLNEAREKAPARRRSRKFAALIAAVIAVTAMTVTAFAAEEIAGWFKQYFTKQTEVPLTPGQIEYIEENEQIIAETQANNGWTVELKSAITDGKTGYVIFGITAPEGYTLGDVVDSPDESRIIPGNAGTKAEGKELFTASVPLYSIEQNYTIPCGYRFEEDGDGKDNTID